ncbi:hypothetical protein VUR80DRAFT_2516 [Thermomyces stellatus]
MAACRACEEPLFLSVDDEEVGDEKIPDDLALSCGCHFHWECFFAKAAEILSSLSCPSCTTALTPASSSSSNAGPAPILTTYTSEGGTEQDLDIIPVLKEESYLAANPHARPARALHVLASEGDVHGAVELLHSVADEGEAESLPSLVRYRDPLAGGKSALHLAVEEGRVGMVWLLLWLSSSLPEGAFPDESRALAEAIGLGRLAVGSREEDIRSLRDENGDVAEVLAKGVEALAPLREAGVLAPPS